MVTQPKGFAPAFDLLSYPIGSVLLYVAPLSYTREFQKRTYRPCKVVAHDTTLNRPRICFKDGYKMLAPRDPKHLLPLTEERLELARKVTSNIASMTDIQVSSWIYQHRLQVEQKQGATPPKAQPADAPATPVAPTSTAKAKTRKARGKS